jgi:predicted amidohydrolase YtcJ
VNHPVPDHRVSVYEAIKMFTINGAYAIFEEDEKGVIEPGKVADVVVLDKDIMKTAPDQIKDIKVITTLKNGQIIMNIS